MGAFDVAKIGTSEDITTSVAKWFLGAGSLTVSPSRRRRRSFHVMTSLRKRKSCRRITSYFYSIQRQYFYAHSSQLPLHPSTQASAAAFLTFWILVISSRCISDDAFLRIHDFTISSWMDFCVLENKKLAKSKSPSSFLSSALANNCSTEVTFLARIKSDTSRLLRRRIFESVLTFVADFFLPASRKAAVEALVRGDPTWWKVRLVIAVDKIPIRFADLTVHTHKYTDHGPRS